MKNLKDVTVMVGRESEEIGNNFYVGLARVDMFMGSTLIGLVDDMNKEFGDNRNLRDLYMPSDLDYSVKSIVKFIDNMDKFGDRREVLSNTKGAIFSAKIYHLSGKNKNFYIKVLVSNGKLIEEKNSKRVPFDPKNIRKWSDLLKLIH